jgi:hypothetical protein
MPAVIAEQRYYACSDAVSPASGFPMEQLKCSMCSAVQRKLDRKVWHWQASIVVCGYCCTHVKSIGSNISHGIKQFVDDPLSVWFPALLLM